MKVSELQKEIEILREKSCFENWLLSIMTMMVFNADKWHFAYDAEVLLKEIDEYIERYSNLPEGDASPVKIGAIFSIYHEFVEGLAYPSYLQMLHSIRNDLLIHWNGVKRGKITIDDAEVRDAKAEMIAASKLKIIKK